MRAWFVAAALVLLPPLSAQNATVRVNAARVEAHVSPRMYAAFAEMMAEDVKWGLTAEMLHDRSFEETADYQGLPAGWQLEPDTRNDNVAAIRFAPTTAEAYPKENRATSGAEHSLRISLAPGDIVEARRGLSQGHLSVKRGESYSGYFWAKVPAKGGYSGPISVSLGEDNTDGATYAEAVVHDVHGDWKRYIFQLSSSVTDRFAKLSILFGGSGTLYVDQVSLQPANARSEVRPDVEAMISGLHPSFLRWPGGNVAQDYHWQWGIGPRDLRPVWVNKSWSNAPEPGDFGTDEYLALCERLHIEPSITVNVDGAGATPEEAAAWVEYVNGPASSKHGAMRAANGHPAPYGVKQWELGNEIFGSWVRGHVTAGQYAQRAVTYAKAMRAVDPSLRLIAVGEGVFGESDDWNAAVLRVAGSSIDYLAIHDYTSRSQNSKDANPRDRMMARTGEFERNYRHIGDLIQQYAPDRGIRLIVNEWNLFYDAETIQSMEGAVYAARMMNGFERDGSVVEANCISDLLNGWVGGVIQASRDRVYGTSQYYALKLWSDHLGLEVLHTESNSPLLSPGANAIDAAASRSADGKFLYVKLSNANQHSAVHTRVDVEQFRHAGRAELLWLQASEPGARNTFAMPDRIQIRSRSLMCKDGCAFDMPADGVAVLVLHRAGANQGGAGHASRHTRTAKD